MPDLIELLLEQISLRTRVFHSGKHCGNWQLNLDKLNKVLFHFVTEGSCMLDLADEQGSIELVQGDLILFPRSGNHVLRANHSSQSDPEEITESDTSGLICAYVEFDSKHRNSLFDALPDYVIVKADSHPDKSWLKHLLNLLFAEADAESIASHTVVERLTDILFIHIIRSYLSNCPVQTGILAAYNDSSLKSVLELMHSEPEKPWSIADFAAVANLSRSAFIEKFSRVIDVPPMTYLTQQRLEYAYKALSKNNCKIIDVALQCGYENESSFSKAFKRTYGIKPSAVK